MENSGKRIVEINGVKLEVDLREAKTVESYKVGQNVKVLIKSYGDSYNSYPGVIVSFDEFEKLPTVVVAYLEIDYSEAKLKFAYLNNQSADTEICPMSEDILFEKSHVMGLFDKSIAKKSQELAELERNKEYFLTRFDHYFKPEEE